MPNRLSQFWQELKRRNVVRVVTVYAGAAFVIIELINNVTEPLRLPEWTPTLVIILLLIGFPIVVIFSWVYDIHPEDGLVKTEPAHKVKPDDIPKSSNSWKIASYISFVVIVGMIVLYVIPRAGKKEVFDKSLAVLPFINESPELENSYKISAYRTAVHNNLCQIKELRLLSLESTEQYKDHSKSPSYIAKELGVGYLVSARGQILNNKIRLTVQLEGANGEIIWSNTYDRQIEAVEDHIDIQSDIAQLVARKLEATITPAEKQRMDNVPTTDLTAFEYIWQAQKYFSQYTLTKDWGYLERVTQLCNLALDLDPGFADAYYWLGKSSLSKKAEDYIMGSLKPYYLDTALYFFDKALELDPNLPEAYAERGIYYNEQAQRQKALEDLQHAIKLSPNNPTAYLNSGSIYYYSRDFINALISLRKAETLIKSDQMLILLYRDLFLVYASAGNWEKIESTAQTLIQRNPQYGLVAEMTIFSVKGNYIELIQKAEEFIERFPKNIYGYLFKARGLVQRGKTQEAEDCIRTMLQYGELDRSNAHRVGIIFWKNRKKDEAMEYFNLQIDYCKESLNTNDPYGQATAAYDLAGVYAFLGKKEEAFRWLRDYESLGFISGTQESIKTDPLFDNLRKDEEFTEIVTRANEKAAALRAEMREMEEY